MNIPEHIIKAAARAIQEHEAETGFLHTPWDDLTNLGREEYLDEARIALDAAAPFIREEALGDFEAYLREGLKEARDGGEQHLHEDALIMLDAYWAQK